MMTIMIKQIHRFLRAARADATALSVCRKLVIVQRVCSNELSTFIPGFCVLRYIAGYCVDNVDSLVLPLHEDAHLIVD